MQHNMQTTTMLRCKQIESRQVSSFQSRWRSNASSGVSRTKILDKYKNENNRNNVVFTWSVIDFAAVVFGFLYVQSMLNHVVFALVRVSFSERALMGVRFMVLL